MIYQGKIFKNCGPTSAQSSALAEDTAFGTELRNSYNTDFGEDEGLFNELHGNLSQIVAAGPSQEGFAAPDLAAMNSQAINSAAATNKDLQATIGEKAGVEDTANPGVESGVTEAVKAGAATKVANNLTNEEENITQADYAQGNKNYEQAVAAEENLPKKVLAPATQAAGAAISADKETSDQANENAAASNSWMGLVGGLASGAVKGLTGGIGSGKGPGIIAPLDAGFTPDQAAAGDYLNEE